MDVYFLIENGNAVGSGFVFRSAFMASSWAAEGQPNLVSASLGHVCVPC